MAQKAWHHLKLGSFRYLNGGKVTANDWRPLKLGVLCLIAGALVTGLYLEGFTPLLKAEYYLKDLQEVQGRKAPANPDMVFLAIDQASTQLDGLSPDEIAASPELTAMSQGWPWPRQVYAGLLDRLFKAGAKVVIFDLIFPTAKPGGGDEAFHAALDHYRSKVVLSANLERTDAAYAQQSTLSLPAPTLIPRGPRIDGRVACAVFFPDMDGVVRRVNYRMSLSDLIGSNAAGNEIDSPSAAALRKTGDAGLVPIGNEARMIRFTGPPGTFPPHSLYEVFVPSLWHANYSDGGFFRNKIVVVGAYGQSSHDEHPSPFSILGGFKALMPGPEIHMHAINAALHQDFLAETSAGWDLSILTAFVLGSWLLNVRIRKSNIRLIVLIGVIVAYGAVLRMLYDRWGTLAPIVAPVASLLLSTIPCITWDSLREQREKTKVRGMLEKYVSPHAVSELLDNPNSFLHSLEGIRKPTTILFSDLRGFTGLTETRGATELVAQLNEYYEAVTEQVFANNGMLDKIMGDAVMAVWGNICTQGPEQDAINAVRAALGMREALARLNKEWAARGLPQLGMGIGLNHGEAVVGNIGSRRKMDLTVIGECVNIAARLEQLTKEYGVDLILGEDLADLVRPAFDMRRVDRVKVKGSTRLIEVYTIQSEHAVDSAHAHTEISGAAA